VKELEKDLSKTNKKSPEIDPENKRDDPYEVRNFQVIGMEFRSLTDEESKKETRNVGGYAVEYNQPSQLMIDYWTGEPFIEVIGEGAFDKSLEERHVKSYWDHKKDMILGNTKSGSLKVESDERGLAFDLILPNNTWGNDAWVSIERRDTEGVSFGFGVIKDVWSEVEYEGQMILKRTIVEGVLFEISPTPNEAYLDSNVECRSLGEYTKTRTTSNEAEEIRSETEKLMLKTELLYSSSFLV